MAGIPHPHLTAGVPGIGGAIKQRLEDFIVEEVPLYEPSGEGEHVYFEVEKTDLSTMEAVERLRRALGCSPGVFGFAGMKDRKGITRQVFSVSGATPEEMLRLEIAQMRILWARRHANKLRLGHLKGNRFTIRIRAVEADERRIAEILDTISEKGVPNYYGPQRFGIRGESHWVGRALLLHRDREAIRRILGSPSPAEKNPDMVAARHLFLQYRWSEALEKFPGSYREERKLLAYLLRHGEKYRGARRQLRMEILKLYLSAYQSYLFNRVLEERLRASGGDLGRFRAGDVAYLHSSGALFLVEDPERETERARAFEISPSGPLFGKRMLLPAPGSLAEEMERKALEEEGLVHGDFHQLQQWCRLEGGRRPLRVPVGELDWRLEGGDLLLRFFLPKGSFATTLLRELMKNEEVAPGFYEGGSAAWFRMTRGG